ncbi:hypothetical protein V8E53_015280 [Lactarius tabidus]
MELDLYIPSFRTTSKRRRSRSPTSSEHDRPFKRLSTPILAIGDNPCDSPLTFQSPHTPVQSVCVSSSVGADASVQDEQWVALTRNLTLLPAQYHAEHDTAWSNNEENTMNLDEPHRPSARLYQHAPRFQYETGEETKIHITNNATPSLVHPNPCTSPRLVLPPATATGYLQTSDHVAIPTPPIGTATLPPHSPFTGGFADTTPLDLRESQPTQQQQAPLRRSRFTMGPRPDCEKCRLGVPGHYAHFD